MSEEMELVEFRVVFAKKTYEIEFGLDQTIAQLKEHLQTVCNCPVASQKLMYKGKLSDTQTLRELKFVEDCKCLLVGATGEQILQVAKMSMEAANISTSEGASARISAIKPVENWNDVTQHKKVLAKGKPGDAIMAYRPGSEPLPSVPIMGMTTAVGKIRLTFKMSEGILVIGTNDKTSKLPLQSVRGASSQAIRGHEEYHILALQLGTTDNSTQYLYWFPAQYVNAVVNLFGKF